MIDRYHLRYFLAVVDHGNFSKAAAACNVSQPTLSVGIAKLERLLGRPLFNRTNRRVELTPAGAGLARHARQIELEFASAEREILDTPVTKEYRLGFLSSLPSDWLATLLQRLLERDPTRRIEVAVDRERSLLEQLSTGKIDLAVTIVRPDVRLAHERLFNEGYGLAMPVAHPLAAREVIEARELAEYPMIVRQHCELLSETSRFFTSRGVRPAFPARTTSDDLAMKLVRSGLGVTIMPDCFQGTGVVRPRLADFGFERAIGMIYAPHVGDRQIGDDPLVRLIRQLLDRARDGDGN